MSSFRCPKSNKFKWVLCHQRIGVHLIDHFFDPHPYGEIGEHIHDAALIGKRRFLENGHILQKAVMDDVFHDLVHEIDLPAVQPRGIKVIRKGGFGGGHIHADDAPDKFAQGNRSDPRS